MQSDMCHAAQITPAYRDRPAYSMTALIFRLLTKYLSNRINTAYNREHVAGLKLVDSCP